jgi:hypothetical protein
MVATLARALLRERSGPYFDTRTFPGDITACAQALLNLPRSAASVHALAYRLIGAARNPRPSLATARTAAVALVVAVLSIPYLIALKSPLRLTPDAVVYLSLARGIAIEMPFRPAGEPKPGPHGYPHLLALLDRAGLGVPWAFVALNLLFLAVGLTSVYLLLRSSFAFDRATTLLACGGTLLVHDVIGDAAIPLSDVTFFGLAMLCLLLLGRSTQMQGLAATSMILGAAVLAAAAFAIRTIGIALWPTVIFVVLSRPATAQRLRDSPRGQRITAAAAAAAIASAVGAAAVIGIMHSGYLRILDAQEASSGSVFGQAKAKLTVAGELATNIPSSSRYVPDAAHPLYYVAGALLIAAIIVGSIHLRRLGLVEVYTASTVLVLLVFPGNLSRLWIPIVPMLIAYVLVAARALGRRGFVRIGLSIYVVAFAAVGVASLADSVRLSLSGPQFPERWTSVPSLQAAYKVAFGQVAPASVGAIDHDALRVLRYYEPRASRDHAPPPR